MPVKESSQTDCWLVAFSDFPGAFTVPKFYFQLRSKTENRQMDCVCPVYSKINLVKAYPR